MWTTPRGCTRDGSLYGDLFDGIGFVRGAKRKGFDFAGAACLIEQKIEGSDILVAAGRIPNTAGVGFEEAGVELDDHGYIRVNERLETTASEVWAIGECAGSPQFTHVSIDDFRIIRDNLEGSAARGIGWSHIACSLNLPSLAWD